MLWALFREHSKVAGRRRPAGGSLAPKRVLVTNFTAAAQVAQVWSVLSYVVVTVMVV
ncbi:hypothetical protein GCM10027517_11720 [Phycicoccus ginsengisoli]